MLSYRIHDQLIETALVYFDHHYFPSTFDEAHCEKGFPLTISFMLLHRRATLFLFCQYSNWHEFPGFINENCFMDGWSILLGHLPLFPRNASFVRVSEHGECGAMEI